MKEAIESFFCRAIYRKGKKTLKTVKKNYSTFSYCYTSLRAGSCTKEAIDSFFCRANTIEIF